MKLLLTALGRGVRGLCPRCGKGKMFKGWNLLFDRCVECNCVLRAREDETWFFMYMSTAAITGIFVIAMLLFRPAHILLGRIAVGILAFLAFISTTGPRKGLAIAIDYFIDSRSQYPKF